MECAGAKVSRCFKAECNGRPRTWETISCWVSAGRSRIVMDVLEAWEAAAAAASPPVVVVAMIPEIGARGGVQEPAFEGQLREVGDTAAVNG